MIHSTVIIHQRHRSLPQRPIRCSLFIALALLAIAAPAVAELTPAARILVDFGPSRRRLQFGLLCGSARSRGSGRRLAYRPDAPRPRRRGRQLAPVHRLREWILCPIERLTQAKSQPLSSPRRRGSMKSTKRPSLQQHLSEHKVPRPFSPRAAIPPPDHCFSSLRSFAVSAFSALRVLGTAAGYDADPTSLKRR